ncbi:signal peptide peptidase SppA [Rhizobiales bacterium TNE-4]|nr:signal peptide peptidase SppA [Rhizobiales bacterium TNE-4]MBV1826161.1 signal peptide peptidase SppA [Rhizobiales bacterium TNE-4]
MSDIDSLLERRRLRRRVGFWRFAAFAVAGIGILASGIYAASTLDNPKSRPHIARVKVSGMITGDTKTLEMLEKIGKSDAKALLVVIDSPGGTVTGSAAIYDALRDVAKKKPVVALIDSMAASGGYITAIGTDRIYARETSIVGSIGVIMQYPNVTRLLDMVGVKMEEYKSTPLKASPNPFENASPEAAAALNSVIQSSYDWFKRLVKTRRNLTDSELAAVADGRIFTGMQGQPLKLVDAIGVEDDAIAWLEKEKGVAKDLPVRLWKRESDRTGFDFWKSGARVADAFGLQPLGRALDAMAQAEEVRVLDGLLAVWHPAAEK